MLSHSCGISYPELSNPFTFTLILLLLIFFNYSYFISSTLSSSYLRNRKVLAVILVSPPFQKVTLYFICLYFISITIFISLISYSECPHNYYPHLSLLVLHLYLFLLHNSRYLIHIIFRISSKYYSYYPHFSLSSPPDART